MRFYVLLIGLCTFLFGAQAQALKVFPPQGCTLLNSGEKLKINSSQQLLILLYNTSNDGLWLNHSFFLTKNQTQQNPASPLCSHKWSALAVNQPKFSLECIEVKPGSEQRIACHEVMKACYYEKAQFPYKSKGSYWIVEDKNLSAVLKKIKQREITLS